MRRTVLAALVLATLASAVRAATFDRVTDAQLRQQADLIVVAQVESAVSRQTGRTVFTDYKLRVEETLRGSAPKVVTVTELGGAAGELIMIIPGSASYEPGTRVVAFLHANGDGRYSTASMAFGAFRFARAADGREVLVRSTDGIESAAPGDIGPRLAREVLDYARGLTDVPPRPLSIEVESAGFEPKADASAPSAYVIKGGVTGDVKPVRWSSCHNGCTIGFKINGVQAVTDSAGGVETAMAAWTGDPNSFLTLDLTGLTTNATATESNGENQILLNNSTPPPPGVTECDNALACGIIWATTSSHTFKSESFHSAFEADVLVRPNSYSQKAFEAIVTHELGHGLAFRHANAGTPSSNTAIMSSPQPTNQGAVLQAWDQEAVAVVYGPGLPCTAPAVTGVSGGGVVPYGSKTGLTATVTGSTPITYQWYEGQSGDTSTPVGTNANTYLTPAITVEHKYWVKATNSCNSASSQTVVVTPAECIKPVITAQPQSQRIDTNTSVTLTVAANGTTPFTYAWYQGNPGDTTNKVGSGVSFKTPNLSSTTTYWVRVTNACDGTDSAAAVITVGNQCVAPVIALQPVNAEVTVGSTATLHVAASGDATIAFQWYEGDPPDITKPVAGATSGVYEAGPFTAAGTFKYWAQAKNSCGSANSNSATITVGCGTAPNAPTEISAPPISPSALAYAVSWTANLAATPSFELQEATNADFVNAKTINVTNALETFIPAHTEVTADTRFYYRVRAKAACTGQFTPYSQTTSTLVTAPLPANSTEFVIGLPEGTTQTLVQNYLVPGFGNTATPGDTFSISSDAEWITVFPPSGALSAGGTTVQITIHPAELGVGSTTGTINVQRTNATAGRITTHGVSATSVPVSVSLVTPVSPTPRNTTPPAGTLLIPAVAHADGIGTRFQSDVRIANAAREAITYEIAFTPSASDGTATGKKTTMVIPSNETKGLDDVVKIWFGSGVGGEAQLGTLEIRPIKLASGAVPSLLSTVASSRTYAIGSGGTLGQFIPALPLSGFIGNIVQDPLARISLQQIANNDRYRTNIGFTEGSGSPADILVKLLDTNNNVIKSETFNLNPYEHRQLGFGGVFGNDVSIADGRIEVEVTSPNGKVTAYASVLDNDTKDPLLVFPVQAAKLSSTHYVVPGVAELNAGSNFHTDMRLYNPNGTPVTVTLTYKPQQGDATPIPAGVTRTINAGQVLAIDNVLPTLWNINASGGAVTVSAANATPLVVTARTFSREADGGTFGQFIPAVTSSDAVGRGERALEILQLEDSGERSQKTGYRSNVGLVEVTGNRVVVELTLRPPDSKLTAVNHIELQGGEFVQLPQVFRFFGFNNVYNGRVSMRVVEGLGRVAGYGSIVDNRTEDPTYVPSQ